MHDPGLQSLRRAARVAIVVPAIFAIFLYGVDDEVAALFAAFASFALLGFADFGGSVRQRAGAYLTLTAVGAVLVVLGSLVSNEAVIAALVAVLVATAARFAGCFGGYFGASVSPIVLAYVLAASVPSPIDALPDRLLGWVAAGLLATVAGVVLWPRRERLVVRESAAVAAGALAEAVEQLANPGGPAPEVLAAMDAAIAQLTADAAVPRRPAGPSAHDEALSFLVEQLERIGVILHLETHRAAVPDGSGELMTTAGAALRSVEATLRSGRSPADLDAQVTACIRAKARVLERAVDELGDGAGADAVVTEIDGLFTERMTLLISASALANASIIVSGRGPSDAAVTIPLEVAATDGVRGTLIRLRRLLRSNAVPASAWAQESLRAGIAVGAAVLIAGELRLDHGFWVVLGTLSVLRSNAFETGRTALMASAGTALGFAISAALLAVVGFDDVGLWIIVVAGFFLSAYTPQVVGFVAGQVSFTIAVVAMFNLLEPAGWQTGLVRVENIVIGSAVSAAVALLFWPRRAVVGLRANVTALYRELGRALDAGLGVANATAPAAEAELRAHASYSQYLSETGRAPNGRRPWATLLAEAAQVRFAIDGLETHRGISRFDACGPTRTALQDAGREVSETLQATASRLEHPDGAVRGPVDVRAVTASTRVPVCDCLQRHAHEAGPEGPLAAGLDAAIVRDLLMEVAVLADNALATVPPLADG